MKTYTEIVNVYKDKLENYKSYGFCDNILNILILYFHKLKNRTDIINCKEFYSDDLLYMNKFFLKELYDYETINTNDYFVSLCLENIKDTLNNLALMSNNYLYNLNKLNGPIINSFKFILINISNIKDYQKYKNIEEISYDFLKSKNHEYSVQIINKINNIVEGLNISDYILEKKYVQNIVDCN